jgi:PPOX class probable F420-dependent enzyme
MPDLKQFEKQQYLNIETFKKNGIGVKTPVWFAQEAGALYIWTDSSSGKSKRIRNNAGVNIAPSKVDGTVTGNWIAALAMLDGSAAALRYIKSLMSRKYGVLFTLFELMGRLRKSQYVVIKVALS